MEEVIRIKRCKSNKLSIRTKDDDYMLYTATNPKVVKKIVAGAEASFDKNSGILTINPEIDEMISEIGGSWEK